jgi:RNA polymerase sigma factor (sigma-70 family)
MLVLTDKKAERDTKSKNEEQKKTLSEIKFTNAYRNYFSLVYFQFLSKTGNSAISEEMSQEVFAIFKKKQKNIPDEKIKKWLFACIRNSLNNYYRKAETSKTFENVEDYYDTSYLSFVNGFQDARIILDECYNSIKYKTILEENIYELIAYYDFSYRRAAKALKISEYKVRTTYKKITNQLLEKLKEKGINKIEDLL